MEWFKNAIGILYNAGRKYISDDSCNQSEFISRHYEVMGRISHSKERKKKKT